MFRSLFAGRFNRALQTNNSKSPSTERPEEMRRIDDRYYDLEPYFHYRKKKNTIKGTIFKIAIVLVLIYLLVRAQYEPTKTNLIVSSMLSTFCYGLNGACYNITAENPDEAEALFITCLETATRLRNDVLNSDKVEHSWYGRVLGVKNPFTSCNNDQCILNALQFMRDTITMYDCPDLGICYTDSWWSLQSPDLAKREEENMSKRKVNTKQKENPKQKEKPKQTQKTSSKRDTNYPTEMPKISYTIKEK